MISDTYVDRKPPVDAATDWLRTYAPDWQLRKSEHDEAFFELGGHLHAKYTVTLVHVHVPDTTIEGTGSTIALAMMHALGNGDE